MEILYQDDFLAAVNKPAGMLVHRTNLAADVAEGFALQTLRDQLGKKVFPVHRIDRPTSGILVFALSSEIAANLRMQFDGHTLKKRYHCIVRGHLKSKGILSHPLKKENGNEQTAITHFELLKHLEFPIQNERFSTTRYSLVKAYPITGRMHQIRRHFAKERNYLIGDTNYGNLKSNRAFQAYFNIEGLMLHASKLALKHPISKNEIIITSDLPTRFHKVLNDPSSS